MKNRFVTTARVLTLALGLLGVTGTASADPPAPRPAAPHAQQAQAPRAPAVRTPAQAKQALVETAQQHGIPHATNANGKVVYNPHQFQHLAPIEQQNREPGVLEIMLFQGTQHTLAQFEGQYLHFQYTPAGHWRMRPWANGLRPSNHRMFGAKIQLNEKEAANMRLRLAGIFAEEGPEHLAGPQWENGHIKESLGARGFNCASAWCMMPIGENGENVAKIIGIPVNGDPFSLQRVLETNSNDRVFGIGLYGPQEPNLGANPNQVYYR